MTSQEWNEIPQVAPYDPEEDSMLEELAKVGLAYYQCEAGLITEEERDKIFNKHRMSYSVLIMDLTDGKLS